MANCAICGSAIIGREVYLAPGSVVRNQIQLEDGAILGMGAVAVGYISEDTVNVGIPARAVRTRTEEDWEKY